MTTTQKDREFQKALIHLKNEHHNSAGHSDRVTPAWYIKTIILLGLVIFFYCSIYFTDGIIIYFIILSFYSIFCASFILNTIHDASHYAIFKSKKHNERLRNITFFLIGNSPHLWWQEHVYDHHPVSNVIGEDLGIIETSLLRFHEGQNWQPYHRFQHLYAPVLYCLHMTDFYFNSEYKKVKALSRRNTDMGIMRWFWIAKLVHIMILIILPCVYTSFSIWVILLGFVFIQAIHSSILVYFLGISHLNDLVPFYADKKTMNQKGWIPCQIESAVDYGVDNRMLTALLGGFNVHIIHHLLPSVSHIHLAPMMKGFKDLSERYGYDYKECSFLELLQSHFRLLQKMGQGSSNKASMNPSLEV